MNEPKTGADLHKESLERAVLAANIIKNMQLKKWAVEQAVAATKDKNLSAEDIEDLTKFFFNFVAGDDNDKQPKG